MKKIIRKAPVLLMVVSIGILLTVLGMGGKYNIYAEQEYDPLKRPLLTLVFQGINEDKYPWQIYQVAVSERELQASSFDVTVDKIQLQPEGEGIVLPQPTVTVVNSPQPKPVASPTAEPEQTSVPEQAPTEEPKVQEKWEEGDPEKGFIDESGEVQPFRESTYDEYINHISADIYGTIGVERAAEYGFVQVEESYFDDALFIGDSRTVGLRDYTTMSEHADFLCENSLTIYKIFERNIGKKGTVEEALHGKEYGKIYLSVGINELGRGTTEDFVGKYKEVVNRLRELEPDAVILVQGIMNVSKAKNEKDAIFNNLNITARNHALATLADNQHIFYIDVNEVVCDQEGNLEGSYTFDEIHLLGIYNEIVKQFLQEHGVLNNFE